MSLKHIIIQPYPSDIHEKAYKNKLLTEKQKANNKTKSKVRARAEHLFGFRENSMSRAMYMTQSWYGAY